MYFFYCVLKMIFRLQVGSFLLLFIFYVRFKPHTNLHKKMPIRAHFFHHYIFDCLYFGFLTFVFIHMRICVHLVDVYTQNYTKQTHKTHRCIHKQAQAHDLYINFCWLCSCYHVPKLHCLFLFFSFFIRPNVDFFPFKEK